MSTPTNSNSHKKGSSRSDVNMGNGIDAGPGGSATKGKFEPTEPVDEELGWGIVRLYRDAAETAGLYEVAPARTTKHARAAAAAATRFGSADNEDGLGVRDEECTTLCILAVPSYLTPSDFLGFVGEATREEVSHFRMIRTERVNRYMVLMKFRNGRRAREWRREWNGKAFDEMEVRFSFFLFFEFGG